MIDQGIRYVLQGNGSSVALALAEAIAKHNERNPGKEILYINYAAVDPDLTNSKCNYWHFRLDANADMKMEALTTYLAKDPKVKSVYLFNQNYSFGQAVAKAAKEYLARKRPDIKIVGDELHPLAQIKDFAPYVSKIRASGADTVITGNWGNDLSLLIKAAKDAMRVTGAGIWGDPADPVEARRVLQRAVELGVDFIDTADAYGPETSERLIAEALHPYPKGLVIATKGGIVRPASDKWERDGRPEHLREACEASLKRLRLERIDLYQLHAIDPEVPLEDSLGEIAKLQQEGKIRHVGVSNFNADELSRARRIVTVVSVQNRSNVADRSSDPMLAVCERDGLAFVPWSPLSQGARDSHAASRAALEGWAKARNVSLPQAAIAWLLARSPAMLPIPGTSKVAHLEENVAAAALRITPAEMAEIG